MPKALVVADSTWVVNEVRSALSIGQWELTETDDPRATVDMVSETRPDVVIVDLQVGSMGGMAVVRDIRQRIPAEERPRTVMLLDRSADRFIARRAGADACVVKPLVAWELRRAVQPELLTTAGVAEEE